MGKSSQSITGQTLDAVFQQLAEAQAAAESTPSSAPELPAGGEPSALDEIAGLGVSGLTGAALSLVPLIRVAWADGIIQKHEREAILAAAAGSGIPEVSATHAQLRGWLDAKPERLPQLYAAWENHIRELKETVAPDVMEQLQRVVNEFARGVAEAAGGILGNSAISISEEQALAEIDAAFE